MSTVTSQLEPEVLKSRIERFRQVQSEIVTQVRRVRLSIEDAVDTPRPVRLALYRGA